MADKQTKVVSFGSFQWSFTLQDQISVEDVVVYLTKAALFHVKTGTRDTTAPLGRDIKDALIKTNLVI